ncbi:SRPBCC domain-containing protein [Rhizobium sp. 2YAF20]|uniref:SRPBCC family protein n=1 Tax=Rhizobium sp. 2YAF20 TaxID=3233027 RepID=UPI003F98BDF5
MFPPIICKMEIDAPEDVVFKHLAYSDGLNKWFTTESSIDQWAGGRIWFRWVEFGPERVTIEDEGEVVEFSEPSLLIFTWKPGVSKTTVKLSIQRWLDRTLVTLTEEGFSDAPEDVRAMLDVACGWGEALMSLKWYLETNASVKAKTLGESDT